MELVILYGPPGVGKLTIARALADRTGYKLFHNHLTTDLVTSIFPFSHHRTWDLVASFRIQMLEAAAEAAIEGVIHTFVYGVGEDDDLMRDLIATAETRGGHAHLVLITCDEATLLERVVSESRTRFGKLVDPEVTRRILADHRVMEPYPHRPGLVIDNTHRNADDVASEIAATLGKDPS
jgi:tRNA uridine 5-carbamoylmethylation protein Kti12